MTLRKETRFAVVRRKSGNKSVDVWYIRIPKPVWEDSNFPFEQSERLMMEIPSKSRQLSDILSELDGKSRVIILTSLEGNE